MFIVRILVLSFLVAYGFAMGKEPALNAFGTLIAVSFFATAPALYLLPTYEAWIRKHPNLSSLALLNVFLGWTLIGWVGALVWAFKKAEPVTVVSPLQTVGHAPPPSAADELRKLADLRKDGVLTDEEFAQRKALVLARKDT